MQVPQIRLQQTYAQTGLRITQPVQEIEQLPAELSIKQVPATMNIDHKPYHLDINQEQMWNELNFKSNSVFSEDMAEFARQEGFEAIAEKSQEGDQMAAIEKKTDAIDAIVTSKANPGPAETIIAFIPSEGSVKINYTPPELNIDWKKGGAEIEVTPHKPNHTYTPGKTEVYLRQMQSLQIDFVGGNINTKS
ncbi:DUF6470 family protein [Neobacillus drentensis]|uniref:DUF6470 family protein n=1 Tax=Neobacillus drentensis TaxID=220684 RepID=UPI002FFF7542